MGYMIVCVYCERSYSTTKDGKVRKHKYLGSNRPCPGSGRPQEFFPLGPYKGPTVARMPSSGAAKMTDVAFDKWCAESKPCRYCGEPFVGPVCPCETNTHP